MRRLLLAVVLLGLVAGCASTATDDTGTLAEQQQTTAAPLDGYSVTVPALDLTGAPLVPLGLNADKSIQVPPLDRPRELGVYANGPKPGEIGPAVILGHVGARGVPGAFANLAAIKVGDEVTTTAPDGTVTRFEVYRTQTVLKRDWPTAAIYSDTKTPELRLATCGGRLDAARHEYDSNVLVWAHKV